MVLIDLWYLFKIVETAIFTQILTAPIEIYITTAYTQVGLLSDDNIDSLVHAHHHGIMCITFIP